MYGGLFKKRSRSDAADVSAKRRAVDATPKKEGSSSGSTGDLPPYTPREVVHYPSTLPFPVVMDDTFPEEPYRSRNGDIKSAIHWGQRKLLLSEIQLLSIYCKPETSYHIVYAGSAPGTHLAFLDTMFASRHTWELVDPGQFDRPVLENRPNFSLRNEFFTNATAYGINARRLRETCPALAAIYTHLTGSTTPEKDDVHHRLQELVGTLDVARGTEDIPCMYEPPVALPCGLDLLTKVAMDRSKPLLFISDIRSGSVALPNFEDHVAENMRAQACWTSILDGAHSMLKFRLPYTSKASGHGGLGAHPETRLIKPNGTVEYLRGEMVLPIWTRPTSTEGRLVVPQGARPVDYNVAHVENQFFFFNATVREMLHFNHILLPHPNLDHHFDGAAEVHCLLTYLKFLHPQLREAPDAVLRQEVLRVSNSITEHLRVTFGDAIRRRDALMLKQAYAGVAAGKVVGEDDDDDDDAPVHRPSEDDCSTDASGWVETTKEMIHRAGLERQRVLWRVNVDESITQEKSKVWVTTKMRQ